MLVSFVLLLLIHLCFFFNISFDDNNVPLLTVGDFWEMSDEVVESSALADIVEQCWGDCYVFNLRDRPEVQFFHIRNVRNVAWVCSDGNYELLRRRDQRFEVVTLQARAMLSVPKQPYVSALPLLC